MELELAPLQLYKLSLTLITLFLYGIGARCLNLKKGCQQLLHYSYMELERYLCSIFLLYNSDYIIPIWNWSSH